MITVHLDEVHGRREEREGVKLWTSEVHSSFVPCRGCTNHANVSKPSPLLHTFKYDKHFITHTQVLAQVKQLKVVRESRQQPELSKNIL